MGGLDGNTGIYRLHDVILLPSYSLKSPELLIFKYPHPLSFPGTVIWFFVCLKMLLIFILCASVFAYMYEPM